ncbi:MAG: 50S ribosomal protein L3 [Candidatus Sumerlaeia bacterium]
MTIGLLGRKLGMTHIYDDKGTLVPVTLIEAGPCPIIMTKSRSTDGYDAIQIGFDPVPVKRVNKPMSGHFKKAGVQPHRVVREFRLDGDREHNYQVGQVLDVDIFEDGEIVDVTGWSKGRGFQGTVRRHHTSRGPETHGSNYHRRPGSRGQSSDPSRVFKGVVGAGRMGNERVTTINLRVVKRDKERHIIAIRGSVPGHPNGVVIIRKSQRRRKKQS